MRIMPGPGTAVVIVQREGAENIPRVGRMTGRAGSISAAVRPDLPEIRYDAQVVLLARVANQKMMAAGVYTGPKDGQDSFRLTGAWSPSDNRRDPRLPVQVKAEVRPVGVRATLPIIIRDLSAGGARVEMPKGAITGEVDVLVRYGGFSATLPAFVLDAATAASAFAAIPEEADEASGDEPAETSTSTDSNPLAADEEDSDAANSSLETGVTSTASAESSEENPAELAAEEKEPAAIPRTAEKADIAAPVYFGPADGPVEYRLRFGELNLPQQGFLRHMLRDLAEISGWELAS